MKATRTLVVSTPYWSTIAAGVHPSELAAVVHANRVIDVTPAAYERGVVAGLRRREAQARCPALAVLEHDPVRDARRFDPVVSTLEQLTPRVEILRPGWCSFPTRGPSRLFGGDAALAERTAILAGEAVGRVIGISVLPDPLVPRVGVADGRFAAGLAARLRGGPVGRAAGRVVPPGDSGRFLRPLPVDVLDGSILAGAGGLVDVLRRLGLRALGDVADLPPEDLLARFGTAGVLAHRLASGLDDRPPDTRPIPDDLTVEVELEPPADRVDTVAFVAKTLADRVDARLGRDGLACVGLLVEAVSERGEVRSRVWRHEHRFTPGDMVDRVRWQLDGWFHSAQRPTGGVALVRLVPEEVVADEGRQLGFWGGQAGGDERAARALARVQGLLGPDAVTVPEWGRGRRANDVERRVTLAVAALSSERPLAAPEIVGAPWPGRLPAPSPAIVHAPREEVEVLDAEGRRVVVDGRCVVRSDPTHLVLAGRRRVIVGWAGPWPLEERWWDTAGRRRQARFQMVLDDGTAHLVVVEGGGWWLEASYD